MRRAAEPRFDAGQDQCLRPPGGVFRVELRRQGFAQAHAVEDRRAHGNVRGVFKKIEYLQDNKGLIYWGKIKQIKDYTQSFRIDFEKKVWFEKKPYSVNVYLSKKLDRHLPQAQGVPGRDQARHRQRARVVLLLWRDAGAEAASKNPEQTFGVFSANIENLDHFIVREAPAEGK
jgi:hypothetical protein